MAAAPRAGPIIPLGLLPTNQTLRSPSGNRISRPSSSQPFSNPPAPAGKLLTVPAGTGCHCAACSSTLTSNSSCHLPAALNLPPEICHFAPSERAFQRELWEFLPPPHPRPYERRGLPTPGDNAAGLKFFLPCRYDGLQPLWNILRKPPTCCPGFVSAVNRNVGCRHRTVPSIPRPEPTSAASLETRSTSSARAGWRWAPSTPTRGTTTATTPRWGLYSPYFPQFLRVFSSPLPTDAGFR